MTFKKFVSEVNRLADYLGTKVTRVFESEGNYTAHLAECAAFDRTSVTGRASSKFLAFNRGTHTFMVEVH